MDEMVLAISRRGKPFLKLSRIFTTIATSKKVVGILISDENNLRSRVDHDEVKCALSILFLSLTMLHLSPATSNISPCF